MTKTYTQLRKQIDALTRDAERLKKKEIDGVIVRIKEAIAAYGLTAVDLGLQARRGPKPGFKRAAGKKAAKKAKGGRSPKPVIRFRDNAGNTWVGRGHRPQWLKDALADGKTLGDFAV